MPFKKGKSGNPKGRPPLNSEQRALRELTLNVYQDVIRAILTSSLKEIKQMIEDPDSPGIKVGIASAFWNAIKRGDYALIDKIAERIIGRIPDTINLNSNNTHRHEIDRDKLKEAMKKLEEDV